MAAKRFCRWSGASELSECRSSEVGRGTKSRVQEVESRRVARGKRVSDTLDLKRLACLLRPDESMGTNDFRPDRQGHYSVMTGLG